MPAPGVFGAPALALPPAHPPTRAPTAGGGRKKLKRREREALLQQHGIALAGQLKGQAAPEQAGSADRGAGGSLGQVEGPAAAAGVPPQPPAPADEDDDIFGDAGTDYVPTVKDKERMQQKAAAAAAEAEAGARRGGYFGGGEEDLHADLPPLPKEGGWAGWRGVMVHQGRWWEEACTAACGRWRARRVPAPAACSSRPSPRCRRRRRAAAAAARGGRAGGARCG